MKNKISLLLAFNASTLLGMAQTPRPCLVQVSDYFCLFLPHNNLLIPLQKRANRLSDAPDHLYLTWVRNKKLTSKL